MRNVFKFVSLFVHVYILLLYTYISYISYLVSFGNYSYIDISMFINLYVAETDECKRNTPGLKSIVTTEHTI